jgi:kinesin family protein 2/24
MQHASAGDLKISICVRKRPINQKEVKRSDYDSVTCRNPNVSVHFCKLKVDGITKYLDNTDFRFDHTFGETSTTEEVYRYTAQPLVEYIFRGGRATVFAYGQTGSGKTYTMAGIQRLAAQDVFQTLAASDTKVQVYFSFFEIYGGRCQDLLNQRNKCDPREDGKGEVQVAGLEEFPCRSIEEMLELVEAGNRERTTHATEVNDESSRSHGICQLALRDPRGKLYGKLSLIDLAGSERGADTKSHNQQRRLESAEINKSLLALKECIRALDGSSAHVPYRASKLTLVLKDSFTMANARTVMIATASPAASSSDHTLNTLRYADRVKEKDTRRDVFAVAECVPPPPPTPPPPPPPPLGASLSVPEPKDHEEASWKGQLALQDHKARERLGFGGREQPAEVENSDHAFEANDLGGGGGQYLAAEPEDEAGEHSPQNGYLS